MDKVLQHKELCGHLNTVYKQKNEKYGDSFGISVQKYGLISALTRISDKFNRLEQLILNHEDGTDTDESLLDTLLDLSNYALMTYIEIENKYLNQTENCDDSENICIEEFNCEGDI